MTKTFTDLPLGSTSIAGEVPIWQGTDAAKLPFSAFFAGLLSLTSIAGWRSALGLTSALVYKGAIDCSANPNYPAADAGHVYKISVAGKIGGASGANVEVGDSLNCRVDSTASGNQATVGANWDIIQTNIDGAVVGPATVTDANPSVFDGTTGKLIKQITYAAFKSALSLVKGDVGLGNVDNTSDATKNSATATLTNKNVQSVALSLAQNSGLVTFYTKKTTGISTSATAIAAGSLGEFLAQVVGADASSNRFHDTVKWGYGGFKVVDSHNVFGSPTARTYALTAGDTMTLAMASGTYDVIVAGPYVVDTH